MLNQFAYKLVFIALYTWPNGEKAKLFEKHMDAVIHKTELSEQEVDTWAKEFDHSPEKIRKRMEQAKINKATYDQ